MATRPKDDFKPFQLEREGASAYLADAKKSRLIEPLPRNIDSSEPWLVNTKTGAIEANCALMAPYGDTVYKEYDPTAAELDALKQGARVTISTAAMSRLLDPRDEPLIALPPTAHAQRRAASAAKSALDAPRPVHLGA